MATRTLRLAKKYPVGDICYRRIVGKPLRKKFMFMWYNQHMKDAKPISIMLYESDLPRLREIRCVYCSRMLCKINADVKSIVFGDGFDPAQHHELVSGMKVMEHKCRGCDCVYKFLFQK